MPHDNRLKRLSAMMEFVSKLGYSLLIASRRLFAIEDLRTLVLCELRYYRRVNLGSHLEKLNKWVVVMREKTHE
jgi:hypothetical protein